MVSVSAFSRMANFISQLSPFRVRKGLVPLEEEVCERRGTGLGAAATACVSSAGKPFGKEARLCFSSC